MSLLEPSTWNGLIHSGGWREGGGGDAAVTEPATGGELARIGLATGEDVARAASSAAQAQRAWADAPYVGRAAVLRRAGELFERHAAEIQRWLIREAGSVPGKAEFETTTAAQECYEASALPSHPLGDLLPSAVPRLSMARRIPAGVVGVIAPFNVPLVLAIRSVAPALALGNAVVLKPDPRTAVGGGMTIARVFEEAGLPPGVLHVLPGGADVGQALVTDPNTRVISFTGSTAAGRKVGEAAARHLKRAHLELGGNSALVVLADADLESAVSTAAWGSYFHQGQICMTTGRHLVHESIADDYARLLAEKADGLAVGDPATEPVALGPIIDAGQRDKIHGLVMSSVDSGGARLAAGGRYTDLFYRPTVLTDVDVDAPAFREEIFGPVAPITRFANEAEAARLAARSEYGLALGILTRDVAAGMELARRIPAGLVHINDQTVNDEAVAPFGGVAASGTGSRFGGAAANIEAFTETQWVTLRGAPPAYPM